jgi:tricorn protease
MKLRFVFLAALIFAFAGVTASADDGPALPSFAEPGISPDHSEIAFVSGGNIWTVPAAGGAAHLLVSFGGAQSRPLYSPDGKKLAFTSSRTGNGDVYVVTLDGGDVKRLTYDDGLDQVEGWSPDGKFVYFASNAKNIGGSSDIYRVAIDGGTPMPVVNERYVHQYESAVSPDGTRMAYIAGGFADSQWWRRGRSHMDESQIAIKTLGSQSYETITPGGAKEMWPMWSPDGRTIYYVSDRTGNENLWSVAPGGKPRQLTSFTTDRVLWPTISRDGRAIAFERDFGIWTYDIASGQTKHLEITRRGALAHPTTDHVSLDSRFGALVLSPDGRKIAFTARGQVFAASARDGGQAQRVTHTHANESSPVWSADSRRLVYVSDRAGGENIFLYDFSSDTETQLTHGTDSNVYPEFSPDGKTIAYQRNTHELRAIDIATKADREISSAIFSPFPMGSSDDVTFSPGGEWIAYLSTESHGFQTVHVVRASGGTAQPVSFLANSFAGSVAWSPDATRLFYTGGQRTEDGQLLQVDLIPRAPKFREDSFRELFQELPSRTPALPRPAASAVPAALSATPGPRRVAEIVFDGIRERLTVLRTGVDVNSARISPDGKTMLLGASAAGQQNLYTLPIDDLTGPSIARQLTATAGRKSNEQYSPDGQTVYFLENGRVFTIAADGRTPARALSLSAELDVDFDRDKSEMFAQAWTDLDTIYYDPHFHGTDWAAVRARYEPHVRGASTPEELRRMLNLMVGEMNSSHSGVNGPQTGAAPETGYLGVRYDPSVYAQSGRLRIHEIIALGPVDLTRTIKVGDEIVAVNGHTIEAHANIESVLANTIGKRTELRIAPGGDASATRTVAVLPTNRTREKALLYRTWVNHNRAYVERQSGGKLGYVHLFDMDTPSLTQLYIDLDVQNQGREGVIVDIRNNNGGFIDPYVVDVFNRRDYISFTNRPTGNLRTSERSDLGQRALGHPTVLLVNEHSLSDAENFTEGYRRSHLGTVVGVPTAGWIIFTSGAQLIDGSTVRLPESGTFGFDGVDMELHPRPVDIRIDRKLGEADGGHDTQLDAAIRQLTHDVTKRR